MRKYDPIIVALDFPEERKALEVAEKIIPYVKNFKVGLELFSVAGPHIVKALKEMGTNVFIDLKLFDIPNTVVRTLDRLLTLDPFMVTLHILGGEEMLRESVKLVSQYKESNKTEYPYLLGVTVLTSFNEETLRRSWGISRSLPEQVLFLAQLAQETGLDGVIASPWEIELLRNNLRRPMLIVTPGIRLTKDKTDDQQRIMTPREALERGSDYLVIGRPITQSSDPYEVIRNIRSQIEDIVESRL
ncbi:orotidine-5'-phosphate decarboxylase [Dictyoglomus thermophilum]|uniref:Orotidine 5'-phosphate decarboxylase n=2 Tax=Dictyoglomus thermophilum TaxID=14 RepID=PYRF_DICT6|nr:orotidine-5'-phosphate decarboxylase [Dictyoglomus thermophilum]B5YFH2.1 RecName: Full=Orotidine 5'-phosphate decarboxylase; AltName: Full=OMP decarboxylase; Short=OMPDCase; Short=OMPdecase [Dictyoglomus thermophilum H-6-12]ACI18378.1 orotidine 5'-phosphate decarboxylase [Dictyoglomus thermophilum H-6-12]TYT22743.1 orotidine-5'-phosphate decarboxylase [Dictyoglomus thermophilum]